MAISNQGNDTSTFTRHLGNIILVLKIKGNPSNCRQNPPNNRYLPATVAPTHKMPPGRRGASPGQGAPLPSSSSSLGPVLLPDLLSDVQGRRATVGSNLGSHSHKRPAAKGLRSHSVSLQHSRILQNLQPQHRAHVFRPSSTGGRHPACNSFSSLFLGGASQEPPTSLNTPSKPLVHLSQAPCPPVTSLLSTCHKPLVKPSCPLRKLHC